MEPPTEALAPFESLLERVERLIPARTDAVEWGHPLFSSTPRSLAIQDLAQRTDMLEEALRLLVSELRNR